MVEKRAMAKSPRKSLKSYEIAAMALVDIDLDFDYEPDIESWTPTYDISISTPAIFDREYCSFVCRVQAGRVNKSGDKSAMVSAIYGVTLKLEGKSSQTYTVESAKSVAGSVVWSKFSVWFLATVSQTPIEFPPLPVVPSSIDVDDGVLETAAADSQVGVTNSEPTRAPSGG